MLDGVNQNFRFGQNLFIFFTMFLLIILSVASFLLSFSITFWVKQYLSQKLVDIPNERSSHTQPTPRGGGLGFVLGFAVTDLVFHSQTHLPLSPQLWLFLTPLILVSLIDDYQGVPSSIRYFVQLITATLVVFKLGSFPLFGLSDWGMGGQTLALVLTVIGMTALINFYNFMDGLDGFVASISLVQISFIALQFKQPYLLLLVAALFGFLWWNWSPAKIFMGDVGSTFLGAIVAISLLFIFPERPIEARAALALTLPLTGDAIYTLIRRFFKRENILKSHRSHLYQRLHQAGWSHRQVALTYLASSFVIILLLKFIGSMGAWISLASICGTIAICEFYLKSKKKTPVSRRK